MVRAPQPRQLETRVVVLRPFLCLLVTYLLSEREALTGKSFVEARNSCAARCRRYTGTDIRVLFKSRTTLGVGVVNSLCFPAERRARDSDREQRTRRSFCIREVVGNDNRRQRSGGGDLC